MDSLSHQHCIVFDDIFAAYYAHLMHHNQFFPHIVQSVLQRSEVELQRGNLFPIWGLEDVEHLSDVKVFFQLSVISEYLTDDGEMLTEFCFKSLMSELGDFFLLLYLLQKVEIDVTFHQVHQWLHSGHVDSIHFNESAFDMGDIEFIPLLEELNEVFPPGLVGFFCESHLHGARIEDVADLYQLLFAVPNLTARVRGDIVGHSINGVLLSLFKEHRPAVHLLILLGFLAGYFHYLDDGVELF
eukprot:CAMPEP_0170544566 /NCGR_PEP_ID=MMETSP0211-20121228/3276_1 /TAXON_ID=311385 /ORGANISM="Pseudokeronopsis sp., Strain OXSARD2" /LENGTH=241 /DNA_ID=CAMNT_0010848243 /DNA_START=1016 /DNA_END=1741 /DNA_ORIENTATION=-